MMFYTHLAFSALVGLISSKYFGFNHWYYFVLLCFFSIIPDIDTFKSFVGQRIPIIPFLLNILFRHRTLFHSLFLPIMLYIYLLFFTTFEIAIAVFLGYVSHLVLDTLTKEGLLLFWPLPYRIKGFIHTNSLLEKGLFVVIVLIIFLIYI